MVFDSSGTVVDALRFLFPALSFFVVHDSADLWVLGIESGAGFTGCQRW